MGLALHFHNAKAELGRPLDTTDERGGRAERGGSGSEVVERSVLLSDVVDTAVDSLQEERWLDAAGLLEERFTEPTICATEVPSYEVEPEYGNGRHFAACHLNAPPDGSGS
ncbi:MAG: hypothetical protein V5A56_14100 [Halolamina sp.]